MLLSLGQTEATRGPTPLKRERIISPADDVGILRYPQAKE
jgi:hypothetical protein